MDGAEEMAEAEAFADEVEREINAAEKRKRNNERASLTAAFEYGFRCCENGMNLQRALAEFKKAWR